VGGRNGPKNDIIVFIGGESGCAWKKGGRPRIKDSLCDNSGTEKGICGIAKVRKGGGRNGGRPMPS